MQPQRLPFDVSLRNRRNPPRAAPTGRGSPQCPTRRRASADPAMPTSLGAAAGREPWTATRCQCALPCGGHGHEHAHSDKPRICSKVKMLQFHSGNLHKKSSSTIAPSLPFSPRCVVL